MYKSRCNICHLNSFTMERAAVTSILLLSIFAAGILADSDVTRVKRQEMQPACGVHLLRRMSKCCVLPKLFSDDVMKGCNGGKLKSVFGNLKNAAKVTGRRLAEASSQISNFAGLNNFTSNFTGEIKRAAKMFSEGGPFCYFECIFKNQSLLTSDGRVDVGAASAAFVSAAPENWKVAAKAATANCSAILTAMYAKMNTTAMPTPPPGVKMCKPCANFFTGCVNSQMMINCPSFTSDGTCSADLAQLKACGGEIATKVKIPAV